MIARTSKWRLPKTWLPKSLFGRNVLLIVGIITIGQLTTALLFLQAVQKPRVDELVDIAVAQVRALSTTLALLKPDEQARFIETFNRASSLQFAPEINPVAESAAPFNLQIRYFMQALAKKIGNPRDVIWQAEPEESIWIRVPVGNAVHWLKLSGKYIRPHFSSVWIFGSLIYGVLAFGGALLIQYRINQPLHRLADAAAEMGNGIFPAALAEDTSTEIAVVSRSFNVMVNNLANQDAERALMLAGISHDLRTPLTKLWLGVEMIGAPAQDELLTAMQRHIEEIDATIEQFIDFARIGGDEAMQLVDVNQLIESTARDFSAQDFNFELELAPLTPLMLRPVAIKRLLTNLMQNAVKYANAGLLIQTQIEHKTLVLNVLDRGPGIPFNQLERMKQPFSRLNHARSEKSGAGLGLAIVDKIARLHAGNLELKPRAGGGLCAIVMLPIHV